MINSDNSYSFEKNDYLECVTFAYNYHMFEGKGSRGRTNQGKRGFGGELDEFVPGKLCEIAVTKILEHFSESKKKFIIDNDIYPDNDERVKSDPDIVSVVDLGKKRKPNLFIEVKRISPSDKMVGIRKSQLDESVKKWEGNIIGDEKIFIVHAELYFEDKNNKKSNDITGMILKYLTEDNSTYSFSKFTDFSSLRCKINHIYNIKDLKEYGRIFKQGEIIPKILFFDGDSLRDKNPFYVLGSNKLRKGFQIVKNFQGETTLNPFVWGSEIKLDYGECKFIGEFNLIEPIKKDKNNRQIIQCISNVKVSNIFFGNYFLKKGKEFQFNLENALGSVSDVKGTDDMWMSITKLKQLTNANLIQKPEILLKHISINI